MADDLKIALLIQADIKQAQEEISKLVDEVDQVGTAGEKASAGVGDLGKAVADTEKSLAGTANQTQAFTSAVGSTASSAAELDESMDRIDQSAKNAGTSTSRFGANVTRVMADLRAFEEANNGAIKSLEDIAAQEERVDRLFGDGLISLQEYEDALANLDKAEASLNKQTASLAKEQEREVRELDKLVSGSNKYAAELRKLDAAADALEEAFKDNKITVDQYNGALAGINRRRAEIEATGDAIGRMGLRSKEARSQIITMSRSLIDGNFESAATDLLRLASNTDKSGAAFLRLAVPVGIAVGSLGAFAAISYKAFQDQRELENALLLTNNAAGLTEASFAAISRSIEESSNTTIGKAEEITLALARTGKFSSDVIASYGTAIAALTEITGKSAEDLAKEFADMDGSIAQWAAKQNETWRFLTAAQYENIRAMEERGDVEGAQLALSQALNDQYATAVTERLGTIESAWVKVRKAASDYWRFAKDLAGGGGDSDADVLERRQAQLEQRISAVRRSGGDPDSDTRVQQYRQEIFDLQSLVRETEQKAQEQADNAAAEAETIAARNRIRDLSLRADRAKQMQAELDKLAKDFEAARRDGSTDPAFSAESQKSLESDIRKKFEERPDASITAAENYVKTLEKQAQAIALTTEELEIQRIAEHNLTVEQQRRVESAQKIIDAEKERIAVAKDEKSLAELRIELLRAQGREFEATNLEMDQQYGELIERLQARNDTANLDLVDQIMDLERLQTRLGQAQTLINAAISEQQQQEAEVNNHLQAGLIGRREAQSQILDLHRQTTEELEKQRPVLEELSKLSGKVGEDARTALELLNKQVIVVDQTTKELEERLAKAVEGGLTDAIAGLAKGTHSFSDAVAGLAQTVVNAIIQISAQQIAMSMLGTSGGGAGIFTGILGAASIFGGGAGAGGANGVTGVFPPSGGGTVFVATGGQVVGPGTGTSDSIPAMLSNNEFVTRAAVVAQQGALNFLHDFNRRGMAALDDWSPVRHSTGGLAGVPAPDMPAPTLGASQIPEPAAAFSAEVANNFQFNLIDDPQRIADSMQSRSGYESFYVMLSRDPAKCRALIGVK